MQEAARETERLENGLLLGAILANRYLSAAYRPTLAELAGWLARFGDEPDAQSIQALLDRLAPGLASAAPTPAMPEPAPVRGRKPAVAASAHALFMQNRDAEAAAVATRLLSGATTGTDVADGLIAGGWSAWRLGETQTARVFFETAHRLASGTTARATSAFWAARAAQRQNDRAGAVIWMRRAAAEGDRFYARIARRALGPSLACVAGATIGEADVDALMATQAGRRSLALLQVGEKRQAEAELRALWLDVRQEPSFDRPILLFARSAGMRTLAEMVEQDARSDDRTPDIVTPASLRPNGGFLVDPPLVYAVVRHESNFHAAAVSHSGAHGLMQIMPVTARALGAGAGYLHDPGENLAVGQRYMMLLADDESVDGDLIRLLAAYSQGLYGFKRWADGMHDAGDPLLFLESIPNPKTRAFITDALVYSWQYAAVLHLPATSLDALAAGEYPRLVRADDVATGGGSCRKSTAQR